QSLVAMAKLWRPQLHGGGPRTNGVGCGRKASITQRGAGSAPRSGRGGRRFKSCHSDQLHTSSVDLSQLIGKAIKLGGGRVHKSVHKRALRMASLTQDSQGNYRARKRLPNDVRDDYGCLYGPRVEAKFFAQRLVPRAIHIQRERLGGSTRPSPRCVV